VWKNIAARASALVGLLFGALSVVAGARVLTGIDRPDYVVLPWLVRYNVAAGIVGVVVGVGIVDTAGMGSPARSYTRKRPWSGVAPLDRVAGCRWIGGDRQCRCDAVAHHRVGGDRGRGAPRCRLEVWLTRSLCHRAPRRVALTNAERCRRNRKMYESRDV
jgi:hypothetical protein